MIKNTIGDYLGYTFGRLAGQIKSDDQQRKIADADSRAIKAASARVVSAIDERLAGKEPASPLIVNFGEKHVNPNHAFVIMDVLDTLKRKNVPFVYAHETCMYQAGMGLVFHGQDSSEIDQLLMNNAHKIIDALQGRNDFHDLIVMGGSNASADTPLRHGIFAEFIMRNGITSHPVDAQSDTRTLLRAHPETLEAISKASDLLGIDNSDQGVLPTSHLGAVARNFYMMQTCEVIGSNTPDLQVIALHTGSAHVGGHFSTSRFEQYLSKSYYPEKVIPFKGSLADLHALTGKIDDYLGFPMVSQKTLEFHRSQNPLQPKGVYPLIIPDRTFEPCPSGLDESSIKFHAENDHLKALMPFFDWARDMPNPADIYKGHQKRIRTARDEALQSLFPERSLGRLEHP